MFGEGLLYPFFLALGLFPLLVSQATQYVCEPVKSHSKPHNSNPDTCFAIFRLSCPSLSKFYILLIVHLVWILSK